MVISVLFLFCSRNRSAMFHCGICCNNNLLYVSYDGVKPEKYFINSITGIRDDFVDKNNDGSTVAWHTRISDWWLIC